MVALFFLLNGVSIILGNDLAGGKVEADPIVSDILCFNSDCDEKIEAYPPCTLIKVAG